MPYQIEKVTYDEVNGVIINKGIEHKLTKMQKNLLNFFIRNPNIITSKRQLMAKVWNRVVTENSVDQIISYLRSYLEENPKKPNIIITHFGKGISFEGSLKKINDSNKIPSKRPLVQIAALLVIALSVLFVVYLKTNTIETARTNSLVQPAFAAKKILILPTSFDDQTIDSVSQNGIRSLMQSSFNNLDSEGQLVFDNTSLTVQQAIEKHWRLEKDLIVLQAKIIKNGDIYESIINLDDGINEYQQVHLKANRIDDLLTHQMAYIAGFNQSNLASTTQKIPEFNSNDKYIKALGYQKLGKLKKAKELIQQVLFEDENKHQVRLTLAEILFAQKAYDQSLSQLNTLKVTDAYQNIGTEIELGLAKVNYAKNKFDQIIDDLTNFQAQHPDISLIKKSKIQLQLASAHLALAHLKTAMKFYKQAIVNIEAIFNPMIYAQSYFGQADILLKNSVDNNVYALFKKAYEYALLAQNIPFQIKALNKMSFISMNNYDWDNAIKLTKQVISLNEMGHDKNNLGMSLGTLVAILNLHGKFTQAQEVNERLGTIAAEIKSDILQLHYLHYKAVLSMNNFDWISAQHIINEQYQLAKSTKNYAMQLNNAFLQMELILLKKDADTFIPEWNKRMAEITSLGFERYQLYMDLYLARYHALVGEDERATKLFKNVSERSLQSQDIEIYVDSQTRLAKVILTTDSKATLQLLNKLEEYNPHPNPYLDIKAQALFNLGQYIEALALINQAKLVYHQSWTAENQALLELIKKRVELL